MSETLPDNPSQEMSLHGHDPEEVMCQCSGTKRKQIRDLFLKGMDQEAISQWTGALSGCGGCEWDIEEYLEELKAAEPPTQAGQPTDS